MAEAFRLQIWNGETDEAKLLDNWIGFPCSSEELRMILVQDGFTGEQLKNYVITGFSGVCPEFDNLCDFFSSTNHPVKENGFVIRENIDELNYLAHILSTLSQTDRTAFSKAVEAGEHNSSVAELINLAYNTDFYNVVEEFRS